MVVPCVLILLLVKYISCNGGSAREVLVGKKFFSPLASGETLTVMTEIQCVHRCLRKVCRHVNYNTEPGMKDNCEIYPTAKHDIEFSTLVDQENWKAIIFQVQLY